MQQIAVRMMPRVELSREAWTKLAGGENIMVERDQVKFYETTGRAKSKPAKHKKGD